VRDFAQRFQARSTLQANQQFLEQAKVSASGSVSVEKMSCKFTESLREDAVRTIIRRVSLGSRHHVGDVNPDMNKRCFQRIIRKQS
jgi:hypothetical protein